MSISSEAPSDEVPDAAVEVEQAALVAEVFTRGKIPKLQSGDEYTINALMSCVGFVAKRHQLSTNAKRALTLVCIEHLKSKRGVTLKAAVGELQDVYTIDAPKRSRRAYLEAWRHRERDLSTSLNAVEEEVVARVTQTMVGLSQHRLWSGHGLNIAVGQRLGTETGISQGRIDALRIAIVHRVMKSIERHASVRTPDESASVQPDDAALHSDGDITDGAADDYAESDPEADLQDLTKKGVDPSKPSKAKPGSEERILHIAACYAAGKPLWKPGDENEMTSPQDEEQSRRARVEASKQATDRVRENLKALTDY